MCTAKAVPELMTISETAKDAILQELKGAPRRPTELLEVLGNRFSDFELKDAMLKLLHEGTLVLTSDRRLRVAEAA